MRLSLHTVICCCVFTTMLPIVQGAPGGEANSSLRKRFREWLQSHMKRDVASNEPSSNIHVGPDQDSHAANLLPPSSFGLNKRPKRSSSSKQSGCALVTCLTHDLVDRLHQMNIKTGVCAPPEKLGSKGYGRRRRSLPLVTPRTGMKQRCNNEDGGQQVTKQKKTEA